MVFIGQVRREAKVDASDKETREERRVSSPHTRAFSVISRPEGNGRVVENGWSIKAGEES